MKKKLSLLLIVICGICLLAGCDNSSSKGENNAGLPSGDNILTCTGYEKYTNNNEYWVKYVLEYDEKDENIIGVTEQRIWGLNDGELKEVGSDIESKTRTFVNETCDYANRDGEYKSCNGYFEEPNKIVITLIADMDKTTYTNITKDQAREEIIDNVLTWTCEG